MTAPAERDADRICRVFSHVGHHTHCRYCGTPMPDPDRWTILLAAACLRRGDAHGALRLIEAA